MLLLFVTLARASTPTCTSEPEVLWPDAYASGIPRDGVLVVVDANNDGVEVWVNGVEVPIEIFGHNGAEVVRGVEPFPAGQAVVYIGPFAWGVTIEDRLAVPLPSTAPDARSRSKCGSLGTETWVTYTMCSGPLQLIVTNSEDEPAIPTLEAPVGGMFHIGYGASRALSDLETVWLGSLDEAGRFGGWVRDVIPTAQANYTEFVEFKDHGPDECAPPDTPWTVASQGPCPEFDPGEDTAAPDDTSANQPPGDPPEPVDSSESEGCGCDTTPRTAPFGAAAAILVPIIRRRRRARTRPVLKARERPPGCWSSWCRRGWSRSER